jgi:RNA polymerase sigma-70 factor (ECF subfamily)
VNARECVAGSPAFSSAVERRKSVSCDTEAPVPAPPLHDAVDPVVVGFFLLLGIAALFGSGLLRLLVGLPAREWQRWCGLRERHAATVAAPPLRHDLTAPAAVLAAATRLLLDELSHAQARASGWSDGEPPGLVSRFLGYRNDDDYRPTINLFGEIALWLQHASALTRSEGPETPEVRRVCERVRGLVLGDGALGPRVDGIIVAIRELDAWFSTSVSSPYRDRCPPGEHRVARCENVDDEDDALSRARVVAKHEDVFRRIATRYANDESAREDLRQEIRLAVWLALPKHRGHASLTTYIRRIAYYCGARFGRRRFRLESLDEPVDRSPGPAEQLDEAELRAALLAALSTLPARQREAIELLMSGLSYREIAGRLGISESNASVRIARARERLRKQLAPMLA